jgi:hypothetical protein
MTDTFGGLSVDTIGKVSSLSNVDADENPANSIRPTASLSTDDRKYVFQEVIHLDDPNLVASSTPPK